MPNLRDALRQRVGWDAHLQPFLHKPLPAGIGWSATLGSLCALLFGLLTATGMCLAMYYNPSPDKAYLSIAYIMQAVPGGALLRGLHHWGAGAMVLAVCAHLATVFFAGSFKAPRELTWLVGVGLLLATLGLGFSGYLLPWDQKAYWATIVSANIPRDVPVVGEVFTRLLLAGDSVSGLTLTRFYAIHMLVLPAIMGLLIVAHIYLVRLHGVAEPERTVPAAPEKVRSVRFYPDHVARSLIVFAAVLVILIVLSVAARIPQEAVAGSADESYLPRPEWYFMWLFQVLTFFSGSWEVVGSIVLPAAALLLLAGIPFLERSRFRGMADRPLATAAGVTAVVGIVYLTLAGFGGALPYGTTLALPDRPLTPTELAGAQAYVKNDCAYCHHIQGRGGRRVGPDLSNVTAKRRTAEYVAAFIKDPQSKSAWSIMPKYDLPETQLKALADFILALDFDRFKVKTVSKEDLAKLGAP
jgi:quinol-cytochrome oxidoreductase complex cytochrome b subunit